MTTTTTVPTLWETIYPVLLIGVNAFGFLAAGHLIARWRAGWPCRNCHNDFQSICTWCIESGRYRPHPHKPRAFTEALA